MMERIVNYLVDKRKIFFLSAIGFILVSGFLLSIPSFDGNLNGFDFKKSEYYKTSLKLDSIFGTQNSVYIKIIPSSNDAREVFAGVQELEKDLSSKYGKAKIISLKRYYFKVFHPAEEEQTSFSNFLKQSDNVPGIKDLISKDKKSFLVILQINPALKLNVPEFTAIISKPHKGIASAKAISFYHLGDTIEKYIRRDVLVLSVVIIGFFILFFLFTFRKLGAIFYTSVVIGISLYASIFLFSVFGFHFNIVTILVIPIVLVLSLSDSIHLLTGYVSLSHIEDKQERIKKVVRTYIIPSFYSSATTSAAFLTFYFLNDSEYIREFGLVTGLCLMAEFFLTFFISPFILGYVNIKKIRNGNINLFGSFLERHRKAFSIVFILLFISSFFFMGRLNFKTSTEIFFPVGSELEKTRQEFIHDFYSQMKLNVLVETPSKYSDAAAPYDLENVVDSLTRLMRLQKGVVSVESATDTFFVQTKLGMRVNLFEMMEEQNSYYQKGIYRVEVNVNNLQAIRNIADSVLPAFRNSHLGHYKISPSSPVLIMSDVNKRVSGSLINSLLTSGISILLMIFLLTRSISLTIASLLPNLVPLSFVVFIYVFMGLDINILTAITAVVCLGLLDDDTIHILYRRLWLKEPLEELSFSILSTSILLTVGFGLFSLSSFRPTQIFGIVSASVFFFGVICELTLMPFIINFREKQMAKKK
jgi:predicted RND superfamily exporter protein